MAQVFPPLKNRSFCGISGIFLAIWASETYVSDSGKWPFHTPLIHTPTKCRPNGLSNLGTEFTTNVPMYVLGVLSFFDGIRQKLTSTLNEAFPATPFSAYLPCPSFPCFFGIPCFFSLRGIPCPKSPRTNRETPENRESPKTGQKRKDKSRSGNPPRLNPPPRLAALEHSVSTETIAI